MHESRAGIGHVCCTAWHQAPFWPGRRLLAGIGISGDVPDPLGHLCYDMLSPGGETASGKGAMRHDHALIY